VAGNVRQLRNLVESMVVLAPTSEIRPEDIPREVREQGRERLLPVRVPGMTREVSGQELTYIVQSLLDLRLQVEDLRAGSRSARNRSRSSRCRTRLRTPRWWWGARDPLWRGGGGSIPRRQGPGASCTSRG